MDHPADILDRICARMTSDIMNRPRHAPKYSEIDADIAHMERRLYGIALASTTTMRPALITRLDPEWERRASIISDLRARLTNLRAQRALSEVLDA